MDKKTKLALILVPVILIIVAVVAIIITLFPHHPGSAYDKYDIDYDITLNIDSLSSHNRTYSFTQYGAKNTVSYKIPKGTDEGTVSTIAEKIPPQESIKKLREIMGLTDNGFEINLSDEQSYITEYSTNGKTNSYYFGGNSNWRVNIFTNSDSFKKSYGQLPVNTDLQNIEVYYSYNQKTRSDEYEKRSDSLGMEIDDSVIDDYLYLAAVKTGNYIVVVEVSSKVYPKYLSIQADADRLLLTDLIEALI